MSLKTIFSDESGYTGPNLTNKEQPYFVLATLAFEEDEARAIRDSIFSGVRAREIKHSSLSKNGKQHGMVREFLKYLQSCEHRFKIYVVDKEFAAVAKVVDYLVEGATHKMGLDIYSDGSAITLANVFYRFLYALETEAYRSELLKLFEGMIRHGSRVRYDAFFDYINQPVASKSLDKVLDIIRATYHVLVPDEILRIGPEALDLSFTTALSLMAEWREETNEDLKLVHDVSSPMVKETRLWEALTALSVEATTIGYGTRTMRFPIGVAITSFEDSRSWVGLQLADVLAGSVARSFTAHKRGEIDRYVSTISEIALNLTVSTSMPGSPDDWSETPANYEPPADALEFIGEFYRETRP